MEAISHESVEVKLENQDLWNKFDTLGTEMVITKVGRRMFPFLKVSISGLRPDESYMVVVDIVKVDDRRYKFNDKENHWQISDSRLLPNHPVGMYVHPMCPCQGSEICLQSLSFNKVKLTNNPHTVSFGHILVESMGRYVPRISIVSYYDFHNRSWKNSSEFTFKETEFIAVTAYMNKDITKLKIDNNPFARAYRGNGHRRKAFENYSYSEDANRIRVDETAEQRSDEEEAISMSYLTNGGENVDGIHVLHVNPSSIIVTDVPPSPPPSASPLERDHSLLPSQTKSTNSEVNVVFGSPTIVTESQVTPTVSCQFSLHPRTSLQGNAVTQNGFVRGETIETEEKSSGLEEGIIEADEGYLFCKVTDVRSIREVSLFSSDQENDSTIKSEEKEVYLSEENKLINKNVEKLDDSCHNNRPSDHSSNPPRNNTKTQNVSKVRYILPKVKMQDKGEKSIMEQYYQNGLMSSYSASIDTGTSDSDYTKENTEERMPKSLDDKLSEIVKEQLGHRELSLNTSNEDIRTPENVKDSTIERECQGSPDASQPPIQISRLSNFVNSVTVPLEYSKTFTSHKYVNDDSSRKNASEKSALLGQKRFLDDGPSHPKRARSMNQSDETIECMDHSSVSLEPVDHSTELLKYMDQSLKEMTKPSDLLNKLFNSIQPQKHFPHKNYKQKEFQCTEKLASRIEYCDLTKSHHQNSSYCPENLQKLTEGQPDYVPTSQGLDKVNSTRNEDPSCVETITGTRQVVSKEASATSRGFPVVLGSYSIPPSQFSKQQIIELNDESRVNRINNENKVPMVYPTETFCPQQKKVKEDLLKYSNKTGPRSRRMLAEEKGEPRGLDIQNILSVFPDKDILNPKKSISNPITQENHCLPSIEQEYIDLNMSTYAAGNRYHDQRKDDTLDHSCYANKGVSLQAIYTFDAKTSLTRAPDTRLPEIYNPTRTTFTGYASNLICSTLPIVTTDRILPSAVSGKFYQTHRQR